MAETATHPPGRNDPCHCGSGKKYKRCCLSKDEEKGRKARAKAAAKASKAQSQDAGTPTEDADPGPTTDQAWRRGAQTWNPYQRLMTPRKRGDG